MRQHIRHDDLKRIKGIGPILERQLLKAGINSYASLAKQTPGRLATLIPNLSAKGTTIQEWIRQAKSLLPNGGEKALKYDSLTTPSQQRYATFNLELLLDRSNHVRRTQIVHVQSGEKNQWAAWDESRLVSYIAHQSHIKLPASRRMVSPVNVKQPESPETVQPLLQTPESNKSPSQQIPLISILLNKIVLLPQKTNIQMQVEFLLAGPRALDIASRCSRFFLEILACDLLTARLVVMTSMEGKLQMDQLDYILSLEFLPPKVGRYQSEIIIFLPEEDAVTIQLGPILTVVP